MQGHVKESHQWGDTDEPCEVRSHVHVDHTLCECSRRVVLAVPFVVWERGCLGCTGELHRGTVTAWDGSCSEKLFNWSRYVKTDLKHMRILENIESDSVSDYVMFENA